MRRMRSARNEEARPRSAHITQLLIEWSEGRDSAQDELLPLVYDRLREIARSYLRKERRDHTLDSSGLVHELYFRLIDQSRVRWQDRAHFFALSSRLMRRILVDHAREKAAQKRGRHVERISLEDPDRLFDQRPPELLALDEALMTLADHDPGGARLVELRYFGGLTKQELAEVLGVSTATVARRWRLVRAWLHTFLVKGECHRL